MLFSLPSNGHSDGVVFDLALKFLGLFEVEVCDIFWSFTFETAFAFCHRCCHLSLSLFLFLTIFAGIVFLYMVSYYNYPFSCLHIWCHLWWSDFALFKWLFTCSFEWTEGWGSDSVPWRFWQHFPTRWDRQKWTGLPGAAWWGRVHEAYVQETRNAVWLWSNWSGLYVWKQICSESIICYSGSLDQLC